MINLFSRLFSKKHLEDNPSVQFGRFSDFYKKKSKYQDWDNALIAYEEHRYLDASEHIINYLMDEDTGNVKLAKEDGLLSFEILQGSKRIVGRADHKTLYAESKIATSQMRNLPVMRLLLEENYNLKYCRYAYDEQDNITIIFQTLQEDASPYKIYNGLKELAIKSDHQDDILLHRFPDLQPIDDDHTTSIPNDVKEVKYRFYQEKLQQVFICLEESTLDVTKYPSGVAYLILAQAYKLDYLLKPEGSIMDYIETIGATYSSGEDLRPEQKNQRLLKVLKEMQQVSKEEFYEQIYETTNTFGVTNVGNHKRLVETVQNELPNMSWYVQNEHHAFAQAIPDYVVGSLLYKYALPDAEMHLLNFYFQIVEEEYFVALGFESFFNGNKVNRTMVNRYFQMLESKYEDKYIDFQISSKSIDFSSKMTFAHSFLTMLKQLNFNRK